jgi:hypothetical protein
MGDIPDDDGPSPQDALGLNPLGTGPLGEGPLGPRPEDEEDDVTPEPETPTGETILQRHKVDRLLTGYNFSRERYQRDKKQWAIDALNAKRELKRKKRKEVDAPLGYAKIEYDKYAHTVNAGEAAFHQLLRSSSNRRSVPRYKRAYSPRMRWPAYLPHRHWQAREFSLKGKRKCFSSSETLKRKWKPWSFWR